MPLVVAREDRTVARRLQRLAEQGQLRRIYPGIYTDDLVQPLEAVVRCELFALSSLIARGCILSHRSALDGGRPTAAGNIFLTGPNRRDFSLPGVTLRMAQGTGPLDSDIRIPAFAGDAFISSQARALLADRMTLHASPCFRHWRTSCGPIPCMWHPAHPLPVVRMLTRAARFSHWLDIRSKDRAFAALKQSHALEQPATAQLAFDDLHIAQA